MADEKVLQHLRRIEGQVKGLQRMVSEERPCDEILTQVSAVQAALGRVTSDLVQSTMARCFEELPPDEVRDKLAKTLAILCKR